MSAGTHAYQFDIASTFGYSRSESYDTDNKSQKFRFNAHDINGQLTYYFADVKTDGGPWALAPFLDKASGIALNYRRNYNDRSTENIGIQGFGVFNGFIVDAGYEQLIGEEHADTQTYRMGFGGYITDTHSLIGRIDYSTSEHRRPITGSGSSYLLSLNYQGFLALGASGQSLGFDSQLAAGKSDSENEQGDGETTFTNFRAGVTYYPINNVGIALSALQSVTNGSANITVLSSQATSAESKSTTTSIGLRAHWFPIQALEVGAAVNTSKGSGETEFRITEIQNLKIERKTEGDALAYNMNVRFRF